MNFRSPDYAIFLFIIFVLYWFATQRNLKAQNALLLAASYYFYAQWDYRFLFLLFFSTLFNFIAGIRIHEAQEMGGRRFWLYVGVVVNVGVLGIFKFSGAWLESISDTLPGWAALNDSAISRAVLPVGLSFYTFCGLSYIIDIFRRKIDPSRDYVQYSIFISFFPAIMAGPIERASHLLSQIQKVRTFDYERAVDGLRQILWGLFKKMVIADGGAEYVNMIFNHPDGYSGSTLVVGAIFFSFQIYADFSGYSDLALGTARLLGIELSQNFAFPYFSRDIAEFWRRWNMSLSSWFRDYVFYPLERRRIPFLGKGFNTMMVFLLTGLWHGANWTFIIWGGLNGLYSILFRLFNQGGHRSGVAAQGKRLPSMQEILQIGFTFGLTTFAWVFFRAENAGRAVSYLSEIFSASVFAMPELPPVKLGALVAVFVILEWLGREQKYAIAQLASPWPRPLRWAFYYAMLFVIFYYSGSPQRFIYSQF